MSEPADEMSKPTFERFNYALRPAKNVERKMICDALSRLSTVERLNKYRYVGFGAVGFYDFLLFHQRLGIVDMVSIEKETDAQRRIEYNRPHSCIRIEWGESHAVLPAMDWTRKRSIVWLDYDKHISAAYIGDISFVTSVAKSGSVLIATFNADTGESDEGAPARRMEKLKSAVGKIALRPTLVATDLAGWGYAKACRNIFADVVQKTLGDRNAPVAAEEKLQFVQLFNFIYRDGTRMVTVGGVFLNKKESSALTIRHFHDLDFLRKGEEQFEIETPVLTIRELRYLDTLLPRVGISGKNPSWIPQEDRRKYQNIYRYFPTFSEVEI